MSEELQVSTATSTSETTPSTSSPFSTKKALIRSDHNTESSRPSSPQKKAKVIETLANKFNLHIAVHNKSGRKNNELSEEEEEWIENFQKDQTLRKQLPEEGMLSTLEWTAVKVYAKTIPILETP